MKQFIVIGGFLVLTPFLYSNDKHKENSKEYKVPTIKEGFLKGLYINLKERQVDVAIDKIPTIKEGFLKGLYVNGADNQNYNIDKPQISSVKKEEKKKLYVKKEIKKPITDNTKKHQKISKNTIDNKNKWALSIFSGLSTINKYEIPAPVNSFLNKSLDNKGTMVGLKLDYQLFNDWFTSLSYQRIAFENELIHNYLVDYNYQFNQLNRIKPYIGVVAGASFIDVNSININGLEKVDAEGSSFIYGLQIGSKYQINSKIDIDFLYQRLAMSHKTNLIFLNSTSHITRDDLDNIYLGLKYKFNFLHMK